MENMAEVYFVLTVYLFVIVAFGLLGFAGRLLVVFFLVVLGKLYGNHLFRFMDRSHIIKSHLAKRISGSGF